MDKLWDLLKALAGSRMALCLVAAILFMLIGLAGGIQYQGIMPINNELLRGLAGLIGLSFLGLAFVSGPSSDTMPDLAELGIKISDPENNAQFTRGTVRGIIKKPIPLGYELRLLRGYPEGGLVPNSHVVVDIAKQTWSAADFDIAGAPGQTRRIEAWLVGSDGTVLLDCWQHAQAVHRITIDQVRALSPNAPLKWLEPIKGRTRDMHRCDFVQVTRPK